MEKRFLAAALLALSMGYAKSWQSPSPTVPNQWLQAEMLAHLNSMVDKYRRLIVPQNSQNYKELKVRKIVPTGADAQFIFVKVHVRVREINGLTGIVLGTSDGTATGKIKWGSVTSDQVCIATPLGEFRPLLITNMSNVPKIGNSLERQAAEKSIQSNIPRETCVPMWAQISVADAQCPERTPRHGKHPPQNGKLSFVIKLSNVSARNVKVRYYTVDGTAKAGVDYVAASGEVRIDAGRPSTYVLVQAILRSGNQGTRRMAFRLNSPVNGKILDGEGVGTISD